MKRTNSATLRNQLSSLLDYVLKGHDIEIQRRNISIAKIIPLKERHENKTKLGRGKKTVKFLGDVIESPMENDWNMHK